MSSKICIESNKWKSTLIGEEMKLRGFEHETFYFDTILIGNHPSPQKLKLVTVYLIFYQYFISMQYGQTKHDHFEFQPRVRDTGIENKIQNFKWAKVKHMERGSSSYNVQQEIILRQAPKSNFGMQGKVVY